MADNLEYASTGSGYADLISVFNANMLILNKHLTQTAVGTRISYGFSEPTITEGDHMIDDIYFQIMMGDGIKVYKLGESQWIELTDVPDYQVVSNELDTSTYIYDGVGVPPTNLGTKGDLYINIEDHEERTGDLYRRTNYTWIKIGNIRGTRGVQGAQGLQGIQGVQGIQGIQGIKGDRGDTGAKGTTWYDGIGEPSTNLGIIGDYYLQTDDETRPVFVKSSSTTWERHAILGKITSSDKIIEVENKIQLESVSTENLELGTMAYVEHSDIEQKLPALYYWSSVGWLPTSSCDLVLSKADVVGIVKRLIQYKVTVDPNKGLSTHDLTDELHKILLAQGECRDVEANERMDLTTSSAMSEGMLHFINFMQRREV